MIHVLTELTIFDIIYTLLSDAAENIYTWIQSSNNFFSFLPSFRDLLAQFSDYPAWVLGFLSFSFSAAVFMKIWGR